MRVCILTVTQNTVTLTNTRGNTPAEGRPRSVFLHDTASTEPTVLCYTGFALESLLLRVGQHFHRDIRDSGR